MVPVKYEFVSFACRVRNGCLRWRFGTAEAVPYHQQVSRNRIPMIDAFLFVVRVMSLSRVRAVMMISPLQ